MPAGLIDQATAVLLLFVTVAENCCVWLGYNVTVAGVRLTVVGGITVTVADADFVVSAWLVAVIVTVCCVATVAGALYSPAVEIAPVPAGLIDQLTAVLLVFVTVAENCCVWFAYNVAAAGVRLTAIGGIKVTIAEADFVASA